ncbi:MAG: prepilin-type N-terminal cleavage/methylation domain-containing protein [Candidatus Microthrix sp.]|uniref:Prepilin-type N-terminal cleavage/methylation domain-containing protein n=1 Tax=Candidatus Neomicrothrix subdominans TaxID=2954438 RepID=A0A936TES1_9ACTN|nr:prepilin-type N-terminal cleavage/methylation domain-containing protein [Candidatus Microthrix sp.]MBK9296999.1 prepilin-type N-terminal cleavage/methylation domain-containing protein [Candidatus Microthrix subdominans]
MIGGVAARRRGQAGLTLIELLVAMVVSMTIMGALGGALILLMRTPPETVAQLTSSASAFQTGSTFADDIQSAGPETGELAVTRNTPGCGGDDKSVVRAVTRNGPDVQVRSYSIGAGGDTLERRVCTGPDQDQALQSAAQVGTVVRDLDPTKRPPVTCRASAVASPAPLTPEGDYQCRLVSMTVTTATNLVFTVDGRRNTVETPLESGAPTKPQCTLVVSADTYVVEAGSERSNIYGRDAEFVVQSGGNSKKAFLKIDLLSPCLGTGEPRFLPGGKDLQSADLSVTLTGKGAGISGNDSFRLTMLPKWFIWNEYRLTSNTMDVCGRQPPALPDPPPPLLSLPCPNGDADSFRDFRVGSDAPPVDVDIPVLGAVQRWYDGTAVNNGWLIDREHTGNEGGSIQKGGWRFASKERKEDVPKLVVTWDPKS